LGANFGRIQRPRAEWLDTPKEAYAEARNAIDHALSIDPISAAAYVSLADIEGNFTFDFKKSRAALQRARELDPTAVARSDTEVWDALSAGRLDDSIALSRQKIQSDPLNGQWLDDLTWMLWDLSRVRVDAVRARLKARQQLKALMLRHGRRYSGKTSWSAAHERYLAAVSFAHPAQDIAFSAYRQAVGEGETRVRRLSESLAQEVEHWRMHSLVSAVMTLRGLDLVAATTVVAELGDLRRFAHPRELMGYLGLVPSEHTTASKRRLGAITGNGHVRRVLIEAAWNYRYPARISRLLQLRQERQPPEIRAIAWHAQLRLHHRYRRLKARGLHHNKICVALARELAAFLWDIGRHITPSP
jgi:tetratricopeptide (TPR) repeat protein